MRRSLFLLMWPGVWLGAQVAGPSPLASPTAHAAVVPGGWIVAEVRAQAALQAGFPGTALALFDEILRDPALPAEARPRLALARVTALLDRGDLTEAEQALRDYSGPRTSAYQLRAGLLALQGQRAGRLAAAKAALAASKPEELAASDRGWWHFLQAGIADAENDTDRRNRAYEEAGRLAVSEPQRARFALEQEQARLRGGRLNEAQLASLRGNLERFQGTRTGYDTLRTYAVALAGVGRGAEAQTLLQRQLAALPATERNVADQLRLVLGLIAGEGSVIGQQAFLQLVREAQRPETQRLALQFLGRAAKTSVERERLRRELGELIAGPGVHPIIEDLLLARAQAALVDKAYAPAEDDARVLLERYPNSRLRAPALSVRLAVAWDTFRYSAAADLIAQLQAIASEGRAELGVLLAEAWFRAGAEAEKRGADGKTFYRNAGDAYDAALRVAPAVVPAGVLIFQQVLADIRADQLEQAAKQLDEATPQLAGDPVNRWQAEWNLVKEMQVRGQTAAAYARVEKLIGSAAPTGGAAVPEELRIRLLWLRAKLAFDNGQPAVTQRQAEELLALLAGGTVSLETGLRAEVSSTTQLLRAQALFAQGGEAAGVEMLKKLRQDFPGARAAQYSYLIEAGYLSRKGDMAGAQGVYISFVDNPVYKGSEYAPLALYEAALNLDRQGLDRQLREAYELLERLIRSYPQDGLVFYARLKQGDLMRKLNDFATARQLYEDLVNNFAGHPDELSAQLALADTQFAQGANSVVNYESAAAGFERLRDLPAAPVDLRVEAGCKWGVALAKRGQPAKASGVFWSVVHDFLLDDGQAAALGAKGRYWLARALLELGQIHEDAGNRDEAQRAYRLIVDHKLGGAALAQDKLNRYRAGAGATP